MRTIQECLQAVLWDGMSALAPLDQLVPAGLITVPVADRPPSRLVLAWPAADPSPLVRSFVRTAAEAYRRAGHAIVLPTEPTEPTEPTSPTTPRATPACSRAGEDTGRGGTQP
jgi:hypothetical protein